MSATSLTSDLTFESAGVVCWATLYRPQSVRGEMPCVVMGHGFSATRGLGLPAYAHQFAAAGLAVLTFDYRHFGDSEGQPRQMLHGRRQQEDFRAALAFARGLPAVDPDRIALWGSSFSAGHVLVLAAADPGVAAAIIQVPGLSATPGFLANVMIGVVVDAVHGLLRRAPYYRPVVGDPGDGAIIGDSRAKAVMFELANDDPTWRNEVALRGMPTGAEPRPSRVTQPLLVCVADHDRLAPPGAARRAARRAPQGELRNYPTSHFDVYLPPTRDELIRDQVDFLRRHLKPEPPT